MNIHPIFVHFPIALLTVYGFLELIRFNKIVSTSWFEYVKGAFVIIGALTSSFALQTGELAEHAYKSADTRILINTHANWASFASGIFALLAVVYVLNFISKSSFQERIQNSVIGPLWRVLLKISDSLYSSAWFMMTASFVGIVAITITGGLGGAIVYGPDVDPVVKIIYTLLIH